MALQQWEYCVMTCTPMTGLDEEGTRIIYQIVTPEAMHEAQIRSGEASPAAAIGQLLNELGEEGWELVTFDTSTNRGVFKRHKS